MTEEHKIRVVLAKPGLDGHDVGVHLVARALRDGGIEVIYLGMLVTADQIVAAALEEDADAVLVSILSGAHMTHLPKILRRMAEQEMSCPLIAGGVIPPADVAELKSLGLKAFFGPGTPTASIVRYIEETLGKADSIAEPSGAQLAPR